MKHLLVALILLLVSGCNILPKTADVHDFGVPVVTQVSRQTATRQPEPITVDAAKWLYDKRIRYRLLYANPTQVRFYMQDKWLAPPPELFEQLLISSNLPSASPLTVSIDAFEQQFTAPGQANVLMHFTVTMPTDKKNVSREFEFLLRQPCPTPDAKGAVAGFSTLAQAAVGKINTWITSAGMD